MQALILEDGGGLRLADAPEPRLETRADALVRITTTTICGGDVHLRHGMGPRSYGVCDRCTKGAPQNCRDGGILGAGASGRSRRRSSCSRSAATAS